MYCFLAHASHVLQPCDLTLFKSLKNAWQRKVKDFVSSHVGETVTKLNFAEVFAVAWHKAAKPSIAVNGFRYGVLYPFNPSAYDKCKVLPGEAPRPLPSSNLDLCEASETTPAVNNAVNHPCREAVLGALRALEESLSDEKNGSLPSASPRDMI